MFLLKVSWERLQLIEHFGLKNIIVIVFHPLRFISENFGGSRPRELGNECMLCRHGNVLHNSLMSSRSLSLSLLEVRPTVQQASEDTSSSSSSSSSSTSLSLLFCLRRQWQKRHHVHHKRCFLHQEPSRDSPVCSNFTYNNIVFLVVWPQ